MICDQARGKGMRTLREDGWDKVVKGITTVEEILSSSYQNVKLDMETLDFDKFKSLNDLADLILKNKKS